MREILFRGKRIDKNQWVYGSYCYAELLNKSGYEHLIIEQSAEGKSHNVVVESVGQYTGLKDKNGKRIFEGDILRLAYHPEKDVIIEWHDARFMFRKRNKPKDNGYERLCCVQNTVDHLKVIGNIHDNPELLEV